MVDGLLGNFGRDAAELAALVSGIVNAIVLVQGLKMEDVFAKGRVWVSGLAMKVLV